ncbi:hypothetical protein GH714_013479 [Hevea brasiliensis]|uniref:DUF3741 domain-containing protein n=1 Tax=Hevea brasiliensis TaxID=3981 RepID=A0A6A6MPF4_HEVBR|nr:hypothetical protein GH714_013479 [Hevea brasiliensis]
MNESTGQTTSCLAITEKRPHRPGGCVGIFFQLFDWNRRFAKKKLFSRKLLPPARAKQSSKNFGGDEKMPKTKSHLIADENSKGFPNVKKNGNRSDSALPKHEMRAAGLVARLMGLESLPAVHRDKHKKVSNSPPCEVKEEKFDNCNIVSEIELLNSEKGSTKVESRPPKLQKTGQFERTAVTRFGAEALQIRNVLSRGRKHHHPKLASSVKSPRISSSRNLSRASRLIDAATRILEPGLQATNRAKCAITYSSSTNYVPKNEVSMDGMRLGVRSPDLLKQQRNDVNYNVDVDKSLMGQSSFKNCGNLPDVVESRPPVEDQPFVCRSSAANVANNSLQGLERIKPRPPISSPEQGRDVAYQRNHCRPQKDEQSSIAFRERTATRNEISVGKGRIPPKAKLNNLQSQRASSAANAITGAKDFVALNRNLSGRTRPRVSTKADNYMVDRERRFCSRRDDSLSQLRTTVRKRRTVNLNPQFDSTGLVSSTAMRQKNVKCDFVSGKELEHNAHNADRIKISLPRVGKRRVITLIRMLLTKTSLQRQLPLRGDTLGALLEQKLKELTSQEEDELINGGNNPKRSTAMILQELISALTAQQPFSPDGHMFSAETTFQTVGRIGGTSVGFSHDGDHLSPGSVLEASFSNDSCISSSLDDSSGRRLLYDSVDYSYDQLQPIETDTDLLDSATSTNDGCMCYKMVTDLLNVISRVLQSISLAGGGLTGSRLTYAKEVILNAELLFGTASRRNSDRTKSFLIGPILFDELETVAGALWTNFICLGFEESKEGSKDSQVRRFLIDFVIECLDSKYSRYCNTGFKAWRRVPLCMNTEMLIEEVGKEARRWTIWLA